MSWFNIIKQMDPYHEAHYNRFINNVLPDMNDAGLEEYTKSLITFANAMRFRDDVLLFTGSSLILGDEEEGTALPQILDLKTNKGNKTLIVDLNDASVFLGRPESREITSEQLSDIVDELLGV